MTGLLFWFVATSRVNRSALGPFDLTARIVLYPITRLLDWPWVGVHLIAIGSYLLLPRVWTGLVSAFAIVSWCFMALVQAHGLFT
jgi:hypothetical protein